MLKAMECLKMNVFQAFVRWRALCFVFGDNRTVGSQTRRVENVGTKGVHLYVFEFTNSQYLTNSVNV